MVVMAEQTTPGSNHLTADRTTQTPFVQPAAGSVSSLLGTVCGQVLERSSMVLGRNSGYDVGDVEREQDAAG